MGIDQRSPDTTELRPHAFLSGRIEAVHPFLGKVDVRIDEPDNRLFRMCDFTSPFNANGLGGIDFMPMVGACCVVMEGFSNRGSGLHADPIVVGFRPRTPDAFLSRIDLKPGDLRLQGPEGNDILLRNNGDIYLVSDHQNLLGFISAQSLMLMRSINYEHELAGGEVLWSLTNDEEGSPVAFLSSIKRYATDSNPYLTVKAGALASGGLSLILHAEGVAYDETPNATYINLVQNSAGFTFNVSSGGTVQCSSRESIDVEALTNIKIKAHMHSEIDAPSIKLTTGSSGIETSESGPMIIRAPRGLIVETSNFQVTSSGQSVLESNTGGLPPVTVDILEWLFSHKHLVETAPGNTLPPYGAPVLYSHVIAEAGANNQLLLPFIAEGETGPRILTTNSVISNKTKVK